MKKSLQISSLLAALVLTGCYYLGGAHPQSDSIVLDVGSTPNAVEIETDGTIESWKGHHLITFGKGSSLKITLACEASSPQRWVVIENDNNILQPTDLPMPNFVGKSVIQISDRSGQKIIHETKSTFGFMAHQPGKTELKIAYVTSSEKITGRTPIFDLKIEVK